MMQTEQMLQELRAPLDALPDPTPVFDLRVGFANDYDGLFAGVFRERQAASAILDRGLGDGRLLVTGRGGGAKTVVLVRIAKEAVERGIATVLLSLKEWTAADNIDWQKLPSSRERISYLFEKLSGLAVHPRKLDFLDLSL